MADLHEILLASKGHDQDWELHRAWFCVLYCVGFVDCVLLICLLELFYLLKVSLKSFSLLDIVLDIFLDFALLHRKLLKLFFQKVSELLFTAMMLIDEPFLDFTEHCVKLPNGLVVAADQFLLYESELI
jgi:hypothetical protein